MIIIFLTYTLQGRNDFAIFVITRELGILTWDEAFLSLRSELLPDALRAKYCELIIGEFAKTNMEIQKKILYLLENKLLSKNKLPWKISTYGP